MRYLYKRVKIDDRTKEYVEKRIEKLEKYLNGSMERQYEVEIDLDKKGKFRVEVMLKTPYALYRSEETSDSIEGSVDVAVDQLEEQVVRDKDKLKSIKKRGAQSIKKKTVLDNDARFRK